MQSGRKHRPRFYCPDLMAGAITAGDEANVATTITLSPPQAHHLLVLRKKLGDEVVLFNQQAGAWQGNIIAMDKKSARVVLGQCLQSPPARAVPAPILAFCLLEKSRLDILLPKAIELGVGEMIAIKSDFTERKKEEWDNALEKWRRVSLAAVEQSERLAAPIIHPAMALTDINTWLTARRADDQLSDDIQIFYGDERRHAPPFLAMLASMGHHSSPKKKSDRYSSPAASGYAGRATRRV